MAGITLDMPELNELDGNATAEMLNDLADLMLSKTLESFDNSASPNGAKWPELKPVTIAKRRKGSSQPLMNTGALRSSYQPGFPYQDSGGMAVDMGSNIEYAAIHNFGGMAGPGRKVEIPQREHMPDPDNLPADLEEDILELGMHVIMRVSDE